jgi:hypothetical protein
MRWRLHGLPESVGCRPETAGCRSRVQLSSRREPNNGDLTEVDTCLSWFEQLTGIENLEIDADFIGAGCIRRSMAQPSHRRGSCTHPNNDSLNRRLKLLIHMNPVLETRVDGVPELWGGRGRADCGGESILDRDGST